MELKFIKKYYVLENDIKYNISKNTYYIHKLKKTIFFIFFDIQFQKTKNSK